MKKKILLLSCIIMATTSIFGQTKQGQRGIGINTENPATTLEVKPGSTDGSTAEGIIAPNLTRAQLISMSSNYNTNHKGAIVYITEITATDPTDSSGKTDLILTPGYYYFDGDRFQIIGGGGPWLKQKSTLPANQTDADIYKLGRVAIGIDDQGDTENSLLYVEGDAKLVGDVSIGKDMNNLTTINGQLTVTNTQPQSNSVVLVIDEDNGRIGTALTTPTLVLFAQKRQNQYIAGTDLTNFNNGVPIVVKWSTDPVPGNTEENQDFTNETSDIVTNNLKIDLDPTTGEFKFNTPQRQQFEISGYVNYIPRVANSALGTLNIIVQVKRVGSTEWLPFTGARIVFPNSGFAQTSVFSPAAGWFNPGDSVRLVVLNPHTTAPTRYPHGAGDAGILRPGGLRYVASFKITAL